MIYSSGFRSVVVYTFTTVGILLLFTSCCQAQREIGSNATEPDSGPPTDDDGRGQFNSGVFNFTHEVEQADLTHILVVKSRAGEPCLLAALNATIQISYRVLEGIVHSRYVSTADIQLPEDVKAQGVCGTNTSRLLLKWGNGTFHLNFTFVLDVPDTTEKNSSWSLTDISVSYDLSNTLVFPGSSDVSQVTAERTDLSLFNTQLGHAYFCQHDVTVQVGSEDEGVKVSFHSVELAAFGVTSPEFPDATDVCVKEDDSDKHEDILVPLIVACCLSAVVIIIVIGYVISRNVQRRRDQSAYRQMQ